MRVTCGLVAIHKVVLDATDRARQRAMRRTAVYLGPTMERLRQTGLIVAAGVIVLLSTGCAEHSSLHFAPSGVMRVSYNPKDCVELPNGQFKCKQVVFTAGIIDASKSK
jgi:hypothetical protein